MCTCSFSSSGTATCPQVLSWIYCDSHQANEIPTVTLSFHICFLCFLPKTIAQKAPMSKLRIFRVPPPLRNSRSPTWQPGTKTLSSTGLEGWDSRDMTEPGARRPPGRALISHSCCCRDSLPIILGKRNTTVRKQPLWKNTMPAIKCQSQQQGHLNTRGGEIIPSGSHMKKTQIGGGGVIFPNG